MYSGILHYYEIYTDIRYGKSHDINDLYNIDLEAGKLYVLH